MDRSCAMRRTAFVFFALIAVTGCRGCRGCERDADLEEQEKRDQQRDHFWRAQIEIAGHGRVKTVVDAFDCTSDGSEHRGECGPKLVRFKERAPALMQALPAPGWRFARWEATIHTPDGGTRSRVGPMPDGPTYLDGFGYADTGEIETVTAVFVPDAHAHDGVHP
jgi:hypothetical protein